jgi:cyclopropane fatty-acyl-phospholipid synthase-like methyltransferase
MKMHIIYILIIILCIQLIATMTTRVKRFSPRAYIRNASFGIAIFMIMKYKNPIYLLIPIVQEIVIDILALKGYHFDKYIATEYAYSEYFEELVDSSKELDDYTELNYDGLFGIDTKDTSQKNLGIVGKWCEKVYNRCIDENNGVFTDLNGVEHVHDDIKKTAEDNKFKWIADNTNIQSDSRVLEIGFGKLNLMIYLRDVIGADVTGVNISNEQVKHAKENGFTAYKMNMWDISPDKLGMFDTVIFNGSTEYSKLSGESSDDVYMRLYDKVQSVLNPGGRVYIACIHFNPDFGTYDSGTYSMNDYIMSYMLWRGNDGSYPYGTDGLTKYAVQNGLDVVHQEDRTIDYYIASVLWTSCIQCMHTNMCKNGYNGPSMLNVLFKTIAAPYYLHTYITYTANKSYKKQPWLWEFIPQMKDGKYVTPVTLQWIVLEKTDVTQIQGPILTPELSMILPTDSYT